MNTVWRDGLHMGGSNQLIDPLARANLPLDLVRRAALPSLTAAERRAIHGRISFEGRMPEIAPLCGMTAKAMHRHLLNGRQKLLFTETTSMLIWLLVEGVDIRHWGATS